VCASRICPVFLELKHGYIVVSANESLILLDEFPTGIVIKDWEKSSYIDYVSGLGLVRGNKKAPLPLDKGALNNQLDVIFFTF
jgi:hypothetical protein